MDKAALTIEYITLNTWLKSAISIYRGITVVSSF